MADSKEKQIDDIVSMLDHFMGGGGGHMDIRFDSKETEGHEAPKKTVTVTNSTDCRTGNLACSIPNLLEGLDDQL